MAPRLKFYGWGNEGEGLDEAERARLFRFVGEKLGGEPRAAAPPPQTSEIALRAPRVTAPASLTNVLTQEPYERLVHTYGKSYPETVRAFARDFANAPDLVAFPETETDIAALFDWAAAAKVAVIPFGAGSSVVGGVEPDRRRRLRRRGQPRHAALQPRARSGRSEPRRAHSGRRAWVQRSRRRSNRMASRFATIRRASNSQRSAAGSPPARAATSPPSTPISTISSKACAR